MPLLEQELGDKPKYTSLRLREEKLKDIGKAAALDLAEAASDLVPDTDNANAVDFTQLPSQANLMLVI